MGRVVVVGGINCDITASIPGGPIAGSSSPGRVMLGAGGVGRNIAHALAMLDVPVSLIGATGDDPLSRWVLAQTEAVGVDVSAVVTSRVSADRPSIGGAYVSILAAGELVHAISDMAAIDGLTSREVRLGLDAIAASDTIEWVVMDLNLPPVAAQAVLDWADTHEVPVVLEPVSEPKAVRVASLSGVVDIVTPNAAELAALTAALDGASDRQEVPRPRLGHTDYDRPRSVGTRDALRIRTWVVTRGTQGAAWWLDGEDRAHLVATAPAATRNANGAGDTFVAGMVAALEDGAAMDVAVAWGCVAGAMAAGSNETVPPDLSRQALSAAVGSPTKEGERHG